MATRRAATAVGRCSQCRFNALHAFASLAGISLPPPSTQAIRLATPTSLRKTFTTSHSRYIESAQPEQPQEKSAADTATVPKGETSGAVPQHGDSTLPWYLQVAGPPRQETPLSARQQLPPIPEDSPELLKPFLEHLSENIGLDDLVLLDLRVLDPPPALGANLMMVIGTARSERHLHVSADRFCRWLRTNYKISPYADGLLGRNELKLKMRRKARRIKLLSNVGSVDDKNVDDGIRTGWVCVNVGAIEAGEQEMEDVDDSNGFVGFGGANNGARLVVQMMTEEKREELDLETLWGGYVARQKRKEAREANKDAGTMPEPLEQVGHAFSNVQNHADASPLVLSQPRESTRFSAMQQRGFHTAVSGSKDVGTLVSRVSSRQSHSNYTISAMFSDPLKAGKPYTNDNDAVPLYEDKAGSNQHVSQMDEYDKEKDESDLEPQIKPGNQLDVPSPSNTTKSLSEEEIRVTLTSLIKHLDRLPLQDARRALGHGPHDESSTSFLQIYYQSIQRLWDSRQVRFRIKPWEPKIAKNHPEYYRALLLSRGVMLNHPEYSKRCLLDHLHGLQMTGSVIVTATYTEYIRGFAVPDYEIQLALEAAPIEGDWPLHQGLPTRSQTQQVVNRESLNMILEVLEDMHLRGINLAHQEILTTLCQALARAQFCEHDGSQPNIETDAVHAITQIMYRHRLPIMGIPYYEQLLESFANAGNWVAYWKCWRGMARRSQSRPARLYQNLFRHMANTANQRMCLDALREWIPEMEREEPAVLLQGDDALIYETSRCLRIADPRSEQIAAQGQAYGEWFRLWRRLSEASRPVSDAQAQVSPDAHLKKPMFNSPSLAEYRFQDELSNKEKGGGEEEEGAGDFSQFYAMKT